MASEDEMAVGTDAGLHSSKPSKIATAKKSRSKKKSSVSSRSTRSRKAPSVQAESDDEAQEELEERVIEDIPTSPIVMADVTESLVEESIVYQNNDSSSYVEENGIMFNQPDGNCIVEEICAEEQEQISYSEHGATSTEATAGEGMVVNSAAGASETDLQHASVKNSPSDKPVVPTKENEEHSAHEETHELPLERTESSTETAFVKIKEEPKSPLPQESNETVKPAKKIVVKEEDTDNKEAVRNDIEKKATSSSEKPSDKEGKVEEHDTEEKEVKLPAEPDTEMVSEDELPNESSKEPLETEAVSDEELPEPAVTTDLPETEAVSEDEFPPEKTERKRKVISVKKSDSSAGGGETEGGKKKLRSSESQKRKLLDGDTYDPSSPTSENSCDESPAAKRAALSSGGSSSVPKVASKTRKQLPELEKYWKAVKEDPSDFTGWTYLLQYVDQENDIDAAREAYDAFLSHYPYCYGYWRKYADYEKRKGNKRKCEE